MNLIGLMLCRNESWVLGLSARVALMWCDGLAILNHRSTDRTGEIIAELQAEFPNRVHVTSTPDPEWHEMLHREMLLGLARDQGATHLAIIDADEVLTGNLLPIIRDHIEPCGPGSMLTLPGYNLRGGLHRYHSNAIWGNRWFSVAFKNHPALHWSAANRGGYDHHQREPLGMAIGQYSPIRHGDGGVMHLWGASERRLIAKHQIYKLTERLRWPEKRIRDVDQMYSWAIRGGYAGIPASHWTFADCPPEWWAPYSDLMKYLDIDAEPWQTSEVKRLIAEHGRDKFAGLDLFEDLQ